MIIELYGLPGSGKSTMARKMENELGYKRIKIIGRSELLWYNFLFFLKYPIKFFVLFWYVVTNSKNRGMFYYKFMNTFLHHNAKYEKAKNFENAVIDQGHFQNIISVFEDEISEKLLNKYIKILPRSEKLLIFALDQDIRRQRLAGREGLPRGGLNSEYLKKWNQVTEKNNALFISFIKTSDINYEVLI